jgi:Tfp pilus assembly protein PilF
MGLRSMAEGFSLARESASRALDSDPDYSPTHATLAWIAIVAERDLANAAGHLTKALELEPGNPDTQRRSAALLNHLGRLDAAIDFEVHPPH